MLVICNGLPRSGSTALYNVMKKFLGNHYTVNDIGFMTQDEISENEDLLLSHGTNSELFILKTHYPLPPRLSAQVGEGSIFEIYTVRDLISVAKSMHRVWNYDISDIRNALDVHVPTSIAVFDSGSSIIVPYSNLSDVSWIFSNVVTKLNLTGSFDDLRRAIEEVNKLAEDSKSDRFRNIKSQWAQFVSGMNAKLNIGSRLRKVLPSSLISRIRDRLLFIDRDTMFHPGHVGSNNNDDLDINLEWVSSRYSNWYALFSENLS